LIVQRHRDIDSSKQIVEALQQNSLPTLVVNAAVAPLNTLPRLF
jgi:hypothetical protein